MCQNMYASMENEKHLHVQYLLTIVPRENLAHSEYIKVDMYKDENKYRLVTGSAQEIIKTDHLIVSVNHTLKIITLDTDTSTKLEQQMLIQGFDEVIDSATALVKKKVKGAFQYTLTYPVSFKYAQVEIDFAEKTKQLNQIYTELSALYPVRYHSIKMEYKIWDKRWKSENGFPFLDNYVVQDGVKFLLKAPWKGYRYLQSEKVHVEPKN